MASSPPGTDTATLLKLLSNPANLEILLLLSTKPSYTRELSRLTGKNETEISRRLRALEKAGIVRGRWRRIEGKSVKVYELAVRELYIKISDGQLILTPRGREAGRPVRVRIATSRPPRVELLVGRDREASIIREPPTPIIVVWGISGVGKTSLVAYALQGEQTLFWHTATRTESAEYLLWRLGLFLSSLGMPELLNYLGSPRASLELATDVASETLRGTNAKLVFDDFQEIEGTPAGSVVSKLCQEADGYYVYIISRTRPRSLRHVPPDRRTEVFLSGLDMGASVELLRALGVALPQDMAREVYRVTSGHPLLLKLLARTIEAEGLEGLRRATVNYIWSEVYESLTPRERRVLLALSAFDEPVPVGLVSFLTGILDPSPYLYRLRDRGVVELYETGFKAHQLVRYLLGEVDRRRYHLRAAEYYRSAGGWDGRLRAMYYYISAGAPEGAAEIVVERVRSDDYTYISRIHAYASMIERLAAHRLPPGLLVYVLHDLALVRKLQSRLTDALTTLDRALSLVPRTGDIVAEASLRSERSFILSDLGRAQEAEEEAGRAIRLAEKAGNPHLLFGALANLVKAQALLGKLEETLEGVRREVEVASLIGDPFYILWARIHLAEVYQLLGRLDQAKKHLEYVLEVAKDLGLTYPMFFVTLVYSAILEAEGDWKALLEWSSRSEKLLGKLGVGLRSCRPKYYRARALAGLGRRREALLEARWALEIAERSEDVEAIEAIRELIRELEEATGQ